MKDKKDLKKQALEIAMRIARIINAEVPESVSDMPYARQYVLEVLIQDLQERV